MATLKYGRDQPALGPPAAGWLCRAVCVRWRRSADGAKPGGLHLRPIGEAARRKEVVCGIWYMYEVAAVEQRTWLHLPQQPKHGPPVPFSASAGHFFDRTERCRPAKSHGGRPTTGRDGMGGPLTIGPNRGRLFAKRPPCGWDWQSMTSSDCSMPHRKTSAGERLAATCLDGTIESDRTREKTDFFPLRERSSDDRPDDPDAARVPPQPSVTSVDRPATFSTTPSQEVRGTSRLGSLDYRPSSRFRSVRLASRGKREHTRTQADGRSFREDALF